MPSRIALHPGHPCVRPCASKSDCFRHSLLDGFSRLGRGCFVQFGVAFTPLSHGSHCRFLPVPRSVQWPDRWRDLLRGPPFRHGCPPECRNQTVLAGAHLETDEQDSILSSAFVRSVNGPTRYHTRSPNTHLPMWCPRPRHSSNGTFPSDPTVSRFSNVVACPIIQAMVF